MKNINLSTAFKGFFMGIAEVIPGVSGGTIAFISGIYETLIKSIDGFDGQTFSLVVKGKWKEAFDRVNGLFLLNLLSGMAIGIVFGIIVITYFLEHYPEPLWGFFFGLVAGSAYLISRHINNWHLIKYVLFVVGVLFAIFMVTLIPIEGSLHPIYIILCGMIAISAFILPGVSGSFMLLILGMYTIVISNLKLMLTDFNFSGSWIIALFAIGCVVGLMWFTKVLSWLFTNYNEQTFVVLTGFLVGSLYKIWPWRNINEVFVKGTGERMLTNSHADIEKISGQEFKTLSETLVFPMDYWVSTPKTVTTIIAALVGLLIVLYMERKNRNASIS